MTLSTLKRTLGEGGSFLDDSNGESNLHAVLKSLVEGGGNQFDGSQASPSAAVFAAKLITQPTYLKKFGFRLGTTGTTSGTTTVVLKKNGTAISLVTLSIAYSEDDGTYKFLDADDFGEVAFAAGDLLELACTVASSTSPANIYATVDLSPVKVES